MSENERGITEQEYKDARAQSNVVTVDYDDHPEDVAGKFAEVLRQIGLKVEVLVPPEDIPSVLYRITKDQ